MGPGGAKRSPGLPPRVSLLRLSRLVNISRPHGRLAGFTPCRPMLNLDQFMDIRFLHRQGHSVREIARLTGHSRNTVRKMLRADASPRPTRRECKSILAPFKEYLRQRWQEHGLSSVRLHQEIASQGFVGCTKLVSRFIARLHSSIQVSQRLTVRFETPPGEQAQCDWAEVGRFAMPDGVMARVYAFVMVLSF